MTPIQKTGYYHLKFAYQHKKHETKFEYGRMHAIEILI